RSTKSKYGDTYTGQRPCQESTYYTVVVNTNTPTVSSTEYYVSRIKQNKLSAVIVVLLLAGIVAVAYWFYIHRASTPVTTIDSIPVLPFEHATHDQNNESLSDGVTQSLFTSLSQLPQLKITARSSV